MELGLDWVLGLVGGCTPSLQVGSKVAVVEWLSGVVILSVCKLLYVAKGPGWCVVELQGLR